MCNVRAAAPFMLACVCVLGGGGWRHIIEEGLYGSAGGSERCVCVCVCGRRVGSGYGQPLSPPTPHHLSMTHTQELTIRVTGRPQGPPESAMVRPPEGDPSAKASWHFLEDPKWLRGSPGHFWRLAVGVWRPMS